ASPVPAADAPPDAPLAKRADEPPPAAAVVRLGKTAFRHFGGVSQLALSRDGKLLATVAEDHTLRVWDAATGRPGRGVPPPPAPPPACRPRASSSSPRRPGAWRAAGAPLRGPRSTPPAPPARRWGSWCPRWPRTARPGS